MVEGFTLHYYRGYLRCYSTLWPALLYAHTPVGFLHGVDDGLTVKRAEGPARVKNARFDRNYLLRGKYPVFNNMGLTGDL